MAYIATKDIISVPPTTHKRRKQEKKMKQRKRNRQERKEENETERKEENETEKKKERTKEESTYAWPPICCVAADPSPTICSPSPPPLSVVSIQKGESIFCPNSRNRLPFPLFFLLLPFPLVFFLLPQ